MVLIIYFIEKWFAKSSKDELLTIFSNKFGHELSWVPSIENDAQMGIWRDYHICYHLNNVQRQDLFILTHWNWIWPDDTDIYFIKKGFAKLSKVDWWVYDEIVNDATIDKHHLQIIIAKIFEKESVVRCPYKCRYIQVFHRLDPPIQHLIDLNTCT